MPHSILLSDIQSAQLFLALRQLFSCSDSLFLRKISICLSIQEKTELNPTTEMLIVNKTVIHIKIFFFVTSTAIHLHEEKNNCCSTAILTDTNGQ